MEPEVKPYPKELISHSTDLNFDIRSYTGKLFRLFDSPRRKSDNIKEKRLPNGEVLRVMAGKPKK